MSKARVSLRRDVGWCCLVALFGLGSSVCLMGGGAQAEANCTTDPGAADMRGYFAGRYEAVGRWPGDSNAFSADAILTAEAGLRLEWEDRDLPVRASAEVQHCGVDRVPALTMQVQRGERRYRAFCRYQSEFDNYARITCRLRQDAADAPDEGVLALFYRHDAA